VIVPLKKTAELFEIAQFRLEPCRLRSDNGSRRSEFRLVLVFSFDQTKHAKIAYDFSIGNFDVGEEANNSMPQARDTFHEVLPHLTTKSVASILETDLDATIEYWMELVRNDNELTCVPLSFQERTGHLPQLFHDLIYRLRLHEATEATLSIAAREHGKLRCRQGYTLLCWWMSRGS
jgi:hypothetical protein